MALKADGLENRDITEVICEHTLADGNEVDALYENEANRKALFGRLNDLCAKAYRRGDPASLHSFHKTLSKIYTLYVDISPAGSRNAEMSMILAGVRKVMEECFLEHEESLIPESLLEGLRSADPEEYLKGLLLITHGHRAYAHPLFEDFLRTRATLADLRDFMVQEITIDIRFDDFLASTQIGTTDGVKLEIASNYWDEMGNGEPARVHTAMFVRTLDHLDIHAPSPDSFATEALVCGNFAMMLSLRRKHFYRAIGHFALIEYCAPRRLHDVLAAWKRSGLDIADAEYHRAHIGIDTDHANEWFEHVIKPVLRRDPAAAKEITLGAICRLNTSERYLDMLLARFSKRCAAAI